MGSKARRVLGLACMTLLCGTALLAQSGNMTGAPTQGPIFQRDSNPRLSFEDAEMMARRARALNEMRQKSLVSDANKLLKLAMELNASGARDRKGISPAERMKKLAQIEKLAKSVREKMSYADIMSPAPPTPFSVEQP
jgi:hypothetical protein